MSNASERLRQFLNQAIRGPSTDALLEALAVGDDLNSTNVQAIHDQLYLVTASGSYLKKLTSNLGFADAVEVGLTDEALRNLAIQTTATKQTTQILLDVLEIFFGQEATRGYVQSLLAEPYALVDGDQLILEFDSQATFTVTVRTADFSDIAQATAKEVSDAITKQLRMLTGGGEQRAYATNYQDNSVSPALSYVQIFSGAKGPVSAVKVLGGRLQNVLKFPLQLPIVPIPSPPVVATGTIEIVDNSFTSPGGFITIAGETFTDGTDWNKGLTAAASMASLASAINTGSSFVSAIYSGGIITVTSLLSGAIGNSYGMSASFAGVLTTHNYGYPAFGAVEPDVACQWKFDAPTGSPFLDEVAGLEMYQSGTASPREQAVGGLWSGVSPGTKVASGGLSFYPPVQPATSRFEYEIVAECRSNGGSEQRLVTLHGGYAGANGSSLQLYWLGTQLVIMQHFENIDRTEQFIPVHAALDDGLPHHYRVSIRAYTPLEIYIDGHLEYTLQYPSLEAPWSWAPGIWITSASVCSSTFVGVLYEFRMTVGNRTNNSLNNDTIAPSTAVVFSDTHLTHGADGNLPPEWTITVQPGNLLRFTWSSGSDPRLNMVLEGDVVDIYGAVFDPLNRGAFSVTSVQSGPAGASWFECVNTQGKAETKSQVYADDLTFLRPIKHTPLSIPRYATIFEVTPEVIQVFIPATSVIVERSLTGSNHLQATVTDSDWFGPYIYDPTQAGTMTEVSTELVSTVAFGQAYQTLSVANADLFPDAPGYLMFEYGTARQEGPVRFIGRPGPTLFTLDPAYRFQREHLPGADVALLSSLYPEEPPVDGSTYAFYLTGTSAARLYSQDLIASLVASGLTLIITVLYPGDVGLGNFGTTNSDKYRIWGGDLS